MSAINLDKVSLSASKPSIDLSKDTVTQDIMINLNWSRGTGKKSFFGFGAPKDIDLDVGCLYRLKNGQGSAIQALGEAFGSFNSAPYIELMGDDRSGSNQDGEFIRINGRHWNEIERVLVYAFIYDGVPNWDSTDGVVKVMMKGEPEVEVRMSGTSNERLCAIALLENVNNAVRVTRLVEYHRDQQRLDLAHSWGLEWGHGRK